MSQATMRGLSRERLQRTRTTRRFDRMAEPGQEVSYRATFSEWASIRPGSIHQWVDFRCTSKTSGLRRFPDTFRPVADGAANVSDVSERIESLDQVDVFPDRFFEDVWSRYTRVGHLYQLSPAERIITSRQASHRKPFLSSEECITSQESLSPMNHCSA